MQPPHQTGQFDVYTPAITVPQVFGLCTAQLCVTLSVKACVAGCWYSGLCRAHPVTTARYVLPSGHLLFFS